MNTSCLDLTLRGMDERPLSLPTGTAGSAGGPLSLLRCMGREPVVIRPLAERRRDQPVPYESEDNVRMEHLVSIVIAISAGMINALQLALLGGISRERGGFEATWISMLASLAGMALLMGAIAWRGDPPSLPSPFGKTWIYAALLVVMTTSLLLAGRGLPPYLVATGLAAIPYLLAAAFVGPRLGLGVYLASIVTGQLTGSIIFDHLGAFGADQRPVDALRLIGVALLVGGVLLIRGRP